MWEARAVMKAVVSFALIQAGKMLQQEQAGVQDGSSLMCRNVRPVRQMFTADLL